MPLTLRPPTRQPQWNLTILCVLFIWQFLVTLYTLWFNIASLIDLLFDSFNHPRGPGAITTPGGRGSGALLYALYYFILCEYHEKPADWFKDADTSELWTSFSLWLVMNLCVLGSIITEVAHCGNQRLSIPLYLKLQIAKTVYVVTIFIIYVEGNIVPARPWTPSFGQWVSSSEGLSMTVAFLWVDLFSIGAGLTCEIEDHLWALWAMLYLWE